MNGSLLHQAGYRHKALSAAIGTSEPTAGHGGSTTIAAGGEIGNPRVPGGASLLSVKHKLHLLCENADNNPPCPVPAEDAVFDLVTQPTKGKLKVNSFGL